jgi:hypothetical protein
MQPISLSGAPVVIAGFTVGGSFVMPMIIVPPRCAGAVSVASAGCVRAVDTASAVTNIRRGSMVILRGTDRFPDVRPFVIA